MTPAGLQRTLLAAACRHQVDVAGVSIDYRRWDGPGKSSVVLVHGVGAHAHWWDHVAPLLRASSVIAVDLSGHGGSTWRPSYSIDAWAAELVTAAQAAWGAQHDWTVVGHSLGGAVALAAAGLDPRVARAVLIDAPFREISDDEVAHRQQRITRWAAAAPRQAELITRFRPHPAPHAPLPHVVEYVARQSTVRRENGWFWRTDPQVFAGRLLALEDLTPLTTPLTTVRPEFGLLDDDLIETLHQRLATTPVVVELPGAGHHAMLEDPYGLAGALRHAIS